MKLSNPSPTYVGAESLDPNELWMSVFGATLVASILLCIGLVAAGGWSWFQSFLESSAAAWTQAIGSIWAIIAAIYISRAQITSDKALERVRLAEDGSKKVLVIDALLEALESSVNLAKSQFNDRPQIPVCQYSIDRIRITAQALAKIDLFACPVPIIKPLLLLFPMPCGNLLDVLREFEESFDDLNDNHENHWPRVHNSFATANLMLSLARETCKAALNQPLAG